MPLIFALALAGTTALNFFVTYLFSFSSLNKVSQENIANIGSLVLEKTLNHLAPASMLANLDTELLDPKHTGMDFASNFDLVTTKQLSLYPQVTQVYYGDRQGNVRVSSREKDGSVSTIITRRKLDDLSARETINFALAMPNRNDEDKQKIAQLIDPIINTIDITRDQQGTIIKKTHIIDYVYDPRLRPWFKAAELKKETVWTPAYLFATTGNHLASGKLGITAASPILGNKYHSEISGVIGVDIMLSELSKFISGLKIGKSGRAFIVNCCGQVIALKDYDVGTTVGENKIPALATISNTNDKAVIESFNLLSNLDSKQKRILNFNTPRFTTFKSGDVKYVSYYLPIPENFGLSWYIGIVVPENDFLGESHQTLVLSVIISIIGIIVILLLSSWAVNKIIGPLMLLRRNFIEVGQLHLDSTPVIESMFVEIDRLNNAFVKMQGRLRTFQKLLPSDNVRKLLINNQDVLNEGEKQRISMYTSNIRGFENIVEQMTAPTIMAHLANFIDLQSAIVDQFRGTVHSSTGDRLSAIWNAQTGSDDHAVNACYSALRFVQRIKEHEILWQQQSLPPLIANIGIESGVAIVGISGNYSQKHYTALGSPVTLSSVLMDLCSYYRVNILLGEELHAEAKHHIECRLIDKIAVGKRKALCIYEPLSTKGKLTADGSRMKELYEKGLQAYFERRWQAAELLFAQTLKINPHDRPSQLMMERCRVFNLNPPADTWSGAFNHEKYFYKT